MKMSQRSVSSRCLLGSLAIACLATVAGAASAAPIDATFNFNLAPADPNVDTLVQQTGAAYGSITDSVSGETINVRAGYWTGEDLAGSEDFGDVNGQATQIVLAGTPANGSGVDVGSNGGTQPNEIQSRQGAGIFNEFIDFEFTTATTLVSVAVRGLGTVSGNAERVQLDFGASSVIITSADLSGETYEFAPGTTLNAGETLRLTALDAGDTSRTSVRLIALDTQIVPEPGSLALGVAGLALLGLRRRG
ncbi:MAG: PEP-CTERM sorting domain-containing protein [Planctomycetota bacterium]